MRATMTKPMCVTESVVAHCDHVVLQVYDGNHLIKQGDVVSELEMFSRHMSDTSEEPGLSKHDILDRRRGYVRRFTYCPDCGTKIDWRQIINMLKKSDGYIIKE